MAHSHILTSSINNGGQAALTRSETLSAGGVISIREEIANGASNVAIAVAFVKAKLQYLMIWADGTMTLETNDSGTPDETFALTSTAYFVWRNTDLLIANPFAGDVTVMYATNSSGAAVNLYIEGLVDVT